MIAPHCAQAAAGRNEKAHQALHKGSAKMGFDVGGGGVRLSRQP
jgi:hypothetical protein